MGGVLIGSLERGVCWGEGLHQRLIEQRLNPSASSLSKLSPPHDPPYTGGLCFLLRVWEGDRSPTPPWQVVELSDRPLYDYNSKLRQMIITYKPRRVFVTDMP